MKDRCSVGKSCGATCIQRVKQCVIETVEKISSSLGKLRNFLSEKVKGVVNPKPPSHEDKIRKESKRFDKDLESDKRKGKVGQWGDRGFDWSSHLGKSRFVGRGAYGVVFISDNTIVKRGKIGRAEASIQNILSKKGLAPKVISYEFDNKPTISVLKPVKGRIAMERAKGKSMDDFDSPNQRVGNKTVADSYWALRAKMHRSGIAHNDLHSGNVFIDPDTGKATALDLGMSQRLPKAALSEALGVFSRRPDYGDVQVKRTDEFPNIGYTLERKKMNNTLGKITDNLPDTLRFLRNIGLSKKDIKDMIDSPTLEPTRSYERRGLWTKISNKDAMEAIRILYEGV